jgi:hypothetical protein
VAEGLKGMLSDIRLHLRHFIPLPHRVPSHLTSIFFSSISFNFRTLHSVVPRKDPISCSAKSSSAPPHFDSSQHFTSIRRALLCFELSSISQIPNHHTPRTRSTRSPSLPRSIRTMTLEILPLGCFTLDLRGCSRHIGLATTT